jgi:hypothetical protein
VAIAIEKSSILHEQRFFRRECDPLKKFTPEKKIWCQLYIRAVDNYP